MREIILEKAGKNGLDFKVIVNDITGCWECLDRKPRQNKLGHIPYKKTYAHRYFYEKFKGKIPEGKVVRHLCNNPKCCNPEHLEIGSQKDNVSDMVKSFRNKNGGRMLSEEQIIYICNSDKPTKVLSEELGFDPSTICRVRNRTSYKHVELERKLIGKKLTSTQAKEIYNSEDDWKEIAKIYNVNYATVYDIKNLKTWRKINGSKYN